MTNKRGPDSKGPIAKPYFPQRGRQRRRPTDERRVNTAVYLGFSVTQAVDRDAKNADTSFSVIVERILRQHYDPTLVQCDKRVLFELCQLEVAVREDVGQRSIKGILDRLDSLRRREGESDG